ncbi:hypothetical protein M090_0896 [Parabacteroides distasonis str. 3776 Po2 i]|uniref:Uncharacterized protein n=1 Tax=Parabacteroides distasonis str. 3776 D15 i TaxID=1339342 RepID=A0AB34LDX8_PARDI|nr:hypothetical protein M091_1951 [Parabacteroides distasonis str. 3776 D15 i]KDS42062.1 hypothetical protein M090_0896 [Parabacteroides distasonis str. 3776 Po2 i]
MLLNVSTYISIRQEMSFKNNTFSYPMQRKSINVKYKW